MALHEPLIKEKMIIYEQVFREKIRARGNDLIGKFGYETSCWPRSYPLWYNFKIKSKKEERIPYQVLCKKEVKGG